MQFGFCIFTPLKEQNNTIMSNTTFLIRETLSNISDEDVTAIENLIDATFGVISNLPKTEAQKIVHKAYASHLWSQTEDGKKYLASLQAEFDAELKSIQQDPVIDINDLPFKHENIFAYKPIRSTMIDLQVVPAGWQSSYD